MTVFTRQGRPGKVDPGVVVVVVVVVGRGVTLSLGPAVSCTLMRSTILKAGLH